MFMLGWFFCARVARAGAPRDKAADAAVGVALRRGMELLKGTKAARKEAKTKAAKAAKATEAAKAEGNRLHERWRSHSVLRIRPCL